MPTSLKERIAWWEEARFGMFIHWGLYAVPQGIWKGKEIEGIGEWIQFRAQIPVAEYEKLCKKFNPVDFNAREWVALAKEAGMKYLVITSKHHDGFAMFKSKASGYNIVDATPFKRDPMKELAKACKAAGIKLCFYYSQDQDWHEPGGRGNSWDFGRLTDEAFAGYLKEKVKPQLEEILTQYGDIGLIWFDTPGIITKKQSLDLKRFVHKLQPNCLVSGRVGHDVGDYGSMGDNMIPAGRVKGYWETPATMNDTWGFKKNDKNWKSTKDLLILLVDLASKGVNYLLNVGPTAKGKIPPASVKRLKEIGAWMKKNGEAIYGTHPNPFPYEFDWGRITWKPGKLYLHFYRWPGKSFVLKGLKSPVTKAYLLADKRRKLDVVQSKDGSPKEHRLELSSLGAKTDKHVSVAVLEIEGEPKVDKMLMQQPDGAVHLPGHMAKIIPGKADTAMGLDRSGILVGWTDVKSAALWEFRASEPGRFAVSVSTAAVHRPREWVGGHTVQLEIGRGTLKNGSVPVKTLKRKITNDEELDVPRTKHFKEALSNVGSVKISEPGTYTVSMTVLDFPKKAASGMQLSFVRLTKE
jgi:alpha-L-fucosidase